MLVLGIETSCDETSAAVLQDGRVLSNVISSQLIHKAYGGVVPELASRAHLRLIIPVVDEALKHAGIRPASLDGVAVTSGPGLIGALIVGVNFAKSFAYALQKPLIAVNHLEAHLYSGFLEAPQPEYPFLSLIVSGGHTQLVLVRSPFDHQILGETRDDAAGEAFDKVAKMLGLGFPGGPLVDARAKLGDPAFVGFPRTLLSVGDYDFSFSGIKTSVLYWLRRKKNDVGGSELTEDELNNVCASFQTAVVDVLVEKCARGIDSFRPRCLTIAGGVSANSELRRRIGDLGKRTGVRVCVPRMEYCTDNGAMIALVGWMKASAGMISTMELDAVAGMSL